MRADCAWKLALGLLWVGCTRTPAPASPDDAGAGAPPVAAAADAGGAWQVTDAQLSAFLVYQRELLPVWARALKEGQGKTQLSASMRKRALEEEEARRRSGLTEGQVEALEQLVGDVLLARSRRASSEDDALAKAQAEIMARLPPEARGAFEQTFTPTFGAADAGATLEEERLRHGAANVDAVLTREAELTQVWAELMQVWAGQ